PALGYDPRRNARLAALPGWAARRRPHDAARIRDEPAPRCEPRRVRTPHWCDALPGNWTPPGGGTGHPDAGRLRLLFCRHGRGPCLRRCAGLLGRFSHVLADARGALGERKADHADAPTAESPRAW